MSSGSEKRIRNLILPVRLSAEERAAIEAAAEAAKLTISSYVRQQLIGKQAPRAVTRKPADHRELVRLLGEIGKIGSNLNQLTKAHNQGLVVYECEIDVALAGLAKLREAILEALGRAPPVLRSPKGEAG